MSRVSFLPTLPAYWFSTARSRSVVSTPTTTPNPGRLADKRLSKRTKENLKRMLPLRHHLVYHFFLPKRLMRFFFLVSFSFFSSAGGLLAVLTAVCAATALGGSSPASTVTRPACVK